MRQSKKLDLINEHLQILNKIEVCLNKTSPLTEFDYVFKKLSKMKIKDIEYENKNLKDIFNMLSNI